MRELSFFGAFLQDPALISCHCHSILYPPHLPLLLLLQQLAALVLDLVSHRGMRAPSHEHLSLS